MKRTIALMLAVIMAFALVMPVFADEYEPPALTRIEGGTTFVRLRETANNLGAHVEWDGPNQTVYFFAPNGDVIIIVVAAAGGFNDNGTVWVPVDFATELAYIIAADSNNIAGTGTPSVSLSDFDLDAFHFSLNLDENGFWQGIRALDFVELFDYQALEIPADVHVVSEAQIQEIIDIILLDYVTIEQIMDREVADGDTLNIDFVGSIDGVEFDGGSTLGMGMYVTLGVTQFIDDFLDQLIGHMPGDVVNVEVTFPEGYHEPSLSGLDALFVTTINYIGGADIMPELTDEFVYTNFGIAHGFTTVDEMLDEVHAIIQEDAIQQFMHDFFTTQVAVTSIPESLISYFQHMMLNHFLEEAAMWGMDLDTLLEMYGFDSIDDVLADAYDDIISEARLSLILQAVAEDAGITVTSDDVAEYLLEAFGITNFDEFVEVYGLPWLKQFTRNQRVIEYIRERVVLV